MYQKFTKSIKNLVTGQKGMTGLETAIILIAFVTVASVLAYSVLSAGIFSAEKGKSAVYSGLQSAQSSLEVKGTVLGETNGDNLTTVHIKLGLVDPNEGVDSGKIHVTLLTSTDSIQLDADNGDFSIDPVDPAVTGTMIVGHDVWNLTVNIDTDNVGIEAYDWFSIQIIPPTGASLQIQRTLPGSLNDYLPLN